MTMKRQMTDNWLKRATCTLLMALTVLTGVYAQPKDEKFNPEEFRAHLEAFVSKKAGLTGNEAKAFFPLFHKMKETQRQKQEEIFRLKRNAPACNASDKEFLATIQKIKRLEVEKAELEEQYYKKMCKAISPRKVFQAMQAEDKFHRRMLHDFRQTDRNKK